MKTILSLIVLALAFSAVTASAGVFSGVKETVKGVANDGKVAVKTVAFPVVHPKKAAHGVKKATVASAKAAGKL